MAINLKEVKPQELGKFLVGVPEDAEVFVCVARGKTVNAFWTRPTTVLKSDVELRWPHAILTGFLQGIGELPDDGEPEEPAATPVALRP